MSKDAVIDPSLLDKKVEKEIKEIESYDRYNTDIIKGIFLLVLVVAGNFVGETLGCQTQRAMSNNVYVKQAVILMLIYFTINFTASNNPHPFEMIKKTLIIWVMYLMFVRMDSGFSLAGIILLMVYYLMSNFTDYHTNLYRIKIENAKSIKEKRELEQDYYLIEKQYQDMREYILYVLIIVVVIGFGMYTREKWAEYHGEFSFKKFVFGIPQCKGLVEVNGNNNGNNA